MISDNAVATDHRSSELSWMLQQTGASDPERLAARQVSEQLLQAQRRATSGISLMKVLQDYGLHTPQGLALLSLAEAYPRVPDRGTASLLLGEKLRSGGWRGGADGQAMTTRVASTVLRTASALFGGSNASSSMSPRGILQAMSGPVMRVVLRHLGAQFVFAETIDDALERARRLRAGWRTYSFDMLGEAALTHADEKQFFQRYLDAIDALADANRFASETLAAEEVSVKLSALDCRYEPLQSAHAVPRLIGKLGDLARAARDRGLRLTVDAEESDRLEMSLQILEGVAADRRLQGWEGLGLAVQAYSGRAREVIAWADALAQRRGMRLIVRLVKGAYWDLEIKRAQELGLSRLPVYTRKQVTDLNYLACARMLLRCAHLSVAFATHNPQTIGSLLLWSANRRDVEFQRLHGMGEGLHEALRRLRDVRCRVYAPVGGYRELLPYLVRRILENGANAGFMYQFARSDARVNELLADPVLQLSNGAKLENEVIVLPEAIYADRRNSQGTDLGRLQSTQQLIARVLQKAQLKHRAAPLIAGRECRGAEQPLLNPADGREVVGILTAATTDQVAQAFDRAARAQPQWAAQGVEVRAGCLQRMADLLESERDLLLALLIKEAGKSLTDALGELREAVDFCRYYATQARRLMGSGLPLPGPSGESNELHWAPRGIFACISPWNFPLAIFIGQISAALVTGNAVIAKPAPQTPLCACAAVKLLWKAGVPADVVALLPGGDSIGAAIVADERLAGVAFTGSHITAHRIARALLTPEARPLVPLLAETGGLNAMIVDSTALLERVVVDVLTSAFQSAGQRCSALRLLCLQEDIAESTLRLLAGAMATLRVGDPIDSSTDIGPVIDAQSKQQLESYVAGLDPAQVVTRCALPTSLPPGHFVAPTLVRLKSASDLRHELFGPILHVATWSAGQLPQLLQTINASGYGLTMGVQTRLNDTIDQVRRTARVGNLYVNRSMIGAVVGTQPFGGEGLSGTGPKAGGPHYLLKFMTERVTSINSMAIGGNVEIIRDAL